MLVGVASTTTLCIPDVSLLIDFTSVPYVLTLEFAAVLNVCRFRSSILYKSIVFSPYNNTYPDILLSFILEFIKNPAPSNVWYDALLSSTIILNIFFMLYHLLLFLYAMSNILF